jgi:hypothetical protein
MFKTEQFVPPCGCRSVGECYHGTFAWKQALEAAVDAFAEEMKAKLVHVAMEKMKSGWDDLEDFPASALEAALREHYEKGTGPENMIDVANFAMFAWNRQQPAEGPYGDG